MKPSWTITLLLAMALAFLAGHVFTEEQDRFSSIFDNNILSNQEQPFKQVLPPAQQDNSAVTGLSPLGGRPFTSSRSENPIADIVARVGPAVVSIDTTISAKESRTSALELPDLLFGKPRSRSFSDLPRYDTHGSGSGVLIRSDGYILTNNHVVKGADYIKITLANNRSYKGRVVGRDSFDDVALVKIDDHNLPFAKLGASAAIRPGDWAIAIGSPLGLSHSVTVGVVSAVGRSLADLNNNVDLIQTDAAINPGNSGGPLLNIRGEVIGINMAIRTDAQNIGFSVPIDVARDSANSILTRKPISRPNLGVSMVDFDPQLADAVGLPERLHGVFVSKVSSDGSAASSGIAEGDVIESVNDTPVDTSSDVQRIVRLHKVGSSLKFGLFRGGHQRQISVMLRPYKAETM